MAGKPVFFDVTGRRAARLSILGWVAAIVSTVLGIGFVASLLIAQPTPQVDLPGRAVAVNPPQLVARAVAPGLLKSAARLAAEARIRRLEIQRLRHFRNVMPARVPAGLQPKKGRALAIGFYVNWGESQDASFSSLKRALPQLDWVIPSWLGLSGPDLAFTPNLDRPSLTYIRTRKPDVAILPMLQNASAGHWYGPELGELLADPARRAALIKNVTDFIAANKLQGVMVDFEDVRPQDHKNLEKFLGEMSDAFTPHDWIIVQAAPFDDDHWPYKAYANIVDYTMLMAYDEADDSSPPGPIAGEDWYERVLDKRMRQLSADSTIIALANYGYDWTQGEAKATTREFSEAMVAAQDAGARIQFDNESNNPHFSYQESDGTGHQIWFLDAVTAYNQMHAADAYQPAGYALWRLGMEDPSILPLLGQPYNAPPPASLKTIPSNNDVDFDGEGEILRVESGPVTGRRDYRVDKDSGDLIDETYPSLPTNYVIRRIGQVDKKLALTFDDGPDPQWTPEILDILKAKHVPATFFVIGANMEAHPGLVQRILSEGHEVGNHTYTHPNLADTPPAAVRLELNATQRLFEALTGRSMRLLRPPYLGDAEPTDAEEIVPIEEAQKLGYITVGTHVDTLDWKMLPVDQMMNLVQKEVANPNDDLRGNIILLHDSGGDRSQTVKLLPVLIDTMRAKGYSFVPVSELGGFKRDEVMPRQPLTVMLYENRVVFLTFSYLGQLLYYAFIAAIILGVGRLLLLCGLALANRIRKRPEPPIADGGRPVTVLIPAFNEEKVIVTTIERILASSYRDLEVLVIDDGSKDHTAYIARSHFARDSRVAVISISNGGKAHALNVGLARARGEVVVALDADTQFNPDTISRLVRWFDDANVGAVAGNAKVGNRINMITRWQALEYIVAQNLERRALSALDTLTVVPGAVGAWRRDVLVKLGGFPPDTLAEDQDLTLAIQVAGYRALFDASAVAWTEAPATIRGLSKQRFRWAYGTLQCLWKYRRVTFNPKFPQLGLVALPQVWLFQILLTTLAPLADLMLVWQLVGQWISYSQHGAEFQNGDLYTVGLYYCLFLAVDLLAAMIGFLMERREEWSLLWWLMLQRFGYRQIMYYVVVRSIATALRGPFVGWGKLERQGTVKAAYSVK
jgi:cellulose synthase/poly-beta-1,6-N-acetylglucosamine synthase-like glycosyltransferase/peptidoglycan/xylan/chitin deacetylase (PgdA/CDA1 family)